MIDGVTVKTGSGKEYVVPPLALRDVRRFHEAGVLAKAPTVAIGLLTSIEAFEAGLEVATAALRRNYPDQTRERVEDECDLRDIEAIVRAATMVGGLQRATPGEAARP